jgi:hypothetical protein
MCSSRADRPSQGQTAPLVLYERTAQTGEISIMVVSSLSRYHNYLYFTRPRWARQLLGAQGSVTYATRAPLCVNRTAAPFSFDRYVVLDARG